MTAGFVLDQRLAGDSVEVTDLPLCRVLLMNDSRYPWLVLVPRQVGRRELADLGLADQHALLDEIHAATAALRALAAFDKLNIGALGNIVEQLHVHVIARRIDDAAWPAPVWGRGDAVRYTNVDAARALRILRSALAS